MALKGEIQTLDGLDESIQNLYVERDGVYVLDVEGVVPKKRHDEFREKNISLSNRIKELESNLSKFDGVDLTEIEKLKETERKLKERKLIDENKVDELFDLKFKQFEADYEKEKSQLQSTIQQLQTERHHMMITLALQKAAHEHGVEETGIDDAVARGEKVFQLKDGKVVAIDGDELLTDGEGNPLTVDSFVKNILPKKAPHLFKTSRGGGAVGGKSSGGGFNGSLKRSEMTAKSKSDFIQAHGPDAYMKLPIS